MTDPGAADQPPAERTAGLHIETCYRHPGEVTGVHCTRCGRPICPRCMIPAPVGHQCPECVGQARREFQASSAARGVRSLRGASATKAILVTLIAVFVVEVAQAGGNSLIVGPPLKTLFRMGALY